MQYKVLGFSSVVRQNNKWQKINLNIFWLNAEEQQSACLNRIKNKSLKHSSIKKKVTVFIIMKTPLLSSPYIEASHLPLLVVILPYILISCTVLIHSSWFFLFMPSYSSTFLSSVLLGQSLVRRRRSGLAVTSELCLPVLQEVFNLSGQTLELLLKICLHGPLQLRTSKRIVMHIDYRFLSDLLSDWWLFS